ncbi:MAG: class I SAM-dependent DNA methyltransferase [Limisphaerales bacterium]
MNPVRRRSQPVDSRALYEGRRLTALAARWDAKASAWDRELQDPACHLNEDGAYARFLAQARRLIGQSREFCARQPMIDAGCGTGLVLAQIIGDFACGIGVDISPEMIRLARAKQIPQARFIVGDCFELAALCPKAGAVLSRGVLLSHYGVEQGEALLRAARASLVPGGFVAFDFLNQAARALHSHAPENKTWFTRAQACDLARRAGFETASALGGESRRVLLLVAWR